MKFFCVGNSLTAGYPGYSPSPDGISRGHGNYKSQYEFWIQEEYNTHKELKISNSTKKKQLTLEIYNKGIPGENTKGLLNRINREIKLANPAPEYCIIIIGTNDLLWGNPISKILLNIKEIHKICQRNSVKSIGGTIPPIRAEQSQKFYQQQKKTLNEKLKTFFSMHSILYVDLFEDMCDKNRNLKEDFAISDGIHFNVQGYKKMGELIFHQAIETILTQKFTRI
ncbi:MAG: hypothetical protein GF317_13680 [Candidatus Lokiarchaeota archaeon]|nr:hypothetical protein [Candidatus Lokiarchaeota archaeon]MBD3200684.1 hypothetical protein [Candidatus Lokiarchaeota archaeon]